MANSTPATPNYSAVAASSPATNECLVECHLSHVARVEVPAILRPAEHLPGTFMLQLSGPGALTARPEQLGAALLEAGKIASLQDWKSCSYYRLHNPFERFVSFKDRKATTLRHGDTLEAQLDTANPAKATIQVIDMDSRETRFSLQFVPPGATAKYIDSILMAAGISPTKCTNKV